MKQLKSYIKKIILEYFGVDKHIDSLQIQINQKNDYIKKLIQYQIHSQDFCPKVFPLILTNNEQNLLTKYLNMSDYYLEFGSGGSTFLALLNSQTKIFSVESDKNWIKYLSSWKIIQNGINNNRLNFVYVNIGPVKEWGVPVNTDFENVFYKYSSNVFISVQEHFDTVFIDGRFRVACVLETILKCDNDVKILIHDYNIRKEYHVIEKYLDVIEQADSLFIFRKKKDINIEEVKLCYEKYKNDWR